MKMSRAECLAQCLDERFGPVTSIEAKGWEEVATWLTEEYLPVERKLVRLKQLLTTQGANYVTWDDPDPIANNPTRMIMMALGIRIEERPTDTTRNRRYERVLVRS
jgi:hypothetical protein